MIEEEDGRQHIVFDKHAIEREIMKVNEEKLLQASNTPLRSEQLSILLGEQGDYDKWEEVLQGCIKLPQNVDEGLRVWYEYITHMSQHDSIQFSWTTEEYCESWSKINENKSTLPGIQVAHIKSLTPNSIAADVVSKLALIPLLVGYSPKTWRNGIDSMIPKKVADLRPSKLRLILLLDARFNHNNKLIGKKMMEYGEQNGILAPEQFGSRKNLSAIDHATNKRLVLDILRQSKQNAVYIANDAKSCYDRIILMVAYLTMRNFGIPALAAKCTISTILRMQHRVRTCYGDSVEYYGGDKWQIKPHGCGQGNGYGPALWACISSPLLHIMRQQGHGTRLQRPISRSPLHIAAFAFVDDTDIIQTESNDIDRIVNDETSKIKELFQATQGATDTWSSILRATGGDLEPSKTFCVPILHKWQGSTSTLLSAIEDELQIHLMTSENQLLAIEKKDPNESFFTLGIWQSPSGDETAQKQYLLEKINDWNYKTNQRTLTWAQAQIASRSTIGKTLLYSLPATAFEERECKELQKTYLRAMLGKIGVVRTAPAIIATAPLWLGGFGLLSFEIEQFVSHIGMLLQHGHQHTSLTGLLLRTSLEYYAVEAGLPGDPLRLPEVQYVTQQTWIFNTIKAMRTYRVHISSDIPSLLPWTTNDIFLMQLFDSQQISRGTLRILNKVRLYLRVVTVSDLLSADGRIYDVNIVSGNRTTCHPNPSYYRYCWPKVPPPTRLEKELWSQHLCLALGISLGALYRPEATELHWTEESLAHARWLYSRRQDRIYQYCGEEKWVQWDRVITPASARPRTRSSSNQYGITCNVAKCPDDCVLLSVQQRGIYVHIDSIGTCGDYEGIVLPNSSRFANTQMHDTAQELSFLYKVILNNGVLFTDGSSDNGEATYAVVVQPPDGKCTLAELDKDSFIHFSGRVDGTTEDIHSYRAELSGILAAIEFTNDLCVRHGVSAGLCTLFCDNKGALFASFGHKRPTPRWSCFDLVRRIRRALTDSPIHWKHQHIKGHQDAGCHFSNLPYTAKGNVLADYFATKAYNDAPPIVPQQNKAPWTLTINDEIVGGNIARRLKTAIYKPMITKRWASIFHISETDLSVCDWGTFYRNIELQSNAERHWMTKYNAKLLPVGRNLKRRRHSQTSTCPCCGEEEDHEHLLRCEHAEMDSTFEDQYEELCAYVNHSAAPKVADAFCFLLRYFRRPLDQSFSENLIAQEQIKLGQGAFLAGLWNLQWLSHQESYHAEHKIKRTAQRWMVNLMHKLQYALKTMWATRNRILHNTHDAETLRLKHLELDGIIQDIYQCKPHQRMMAHCDNFYFGRYDRDKLKHMKLQKKTNWIAGANLILTKYERATTLQSERFTSYFQWDKG